MSAWRREALIAIPGRRALIQACASPMELWIELRTIFEAAFARRERAKKGGAPCGDDERAVTRIVAYACWCMSDQSGPLPNDTSTAVACAFLEHLPENEETWPYLLKWFTRRELQVL